jgi:septum formation inhibitor MinC
MDTAYLKHSIGPALSEALTELILHGHGQSHPKLSSNLETNPYSTQEDPVTFVARYLLNYSEKADKCKRDDQEKQKITKIIDSIHQKKREAELIIQKAQEEKLAQELLEAQLAQEKLNASLEQEAAPAQDPPEADPPQSENTTNISDQSPQNDAPEGEQPQESNAE